MNRLGFILKVIFLCSTLFFISCSITEQNLQTDTESKIEESNAVEVTDKRIEIITENDGEISTRDISQSRDLSVYLQGGHFNTEIERAGKEKDVRDFVWKCWNEKRRGYVRVSYVSIEGVVSTSHIFIEPDESEKWRVIWRIVRSEYILNDVPELTAVERVENEPVKGNWALAFKDASGNILETIPYFYVEK